MGWGGAGAGAGAGAGSWGLEGLWGLDIGLELVWDFFPHTNENAIQSEIHTISIYPALGSLGFRILGILGFRVLG